MVKAAHATIMETRIGISTLNPTVVTRTDVTLISNILNKISPNPSYLSHLRVLKHCKRESE